MPRGGTKKIQTFFHDERQKIKQIVNVSLYHDFVCFVVHYFVLQDFNKMIPTLNNMFRLCKSAVKAVTPIRMSVRHYEMPVRPCKPFVKTVTPLQMTVRHYDIPAHLVKVGDEENPSFFRMVEYFYHNAVKVCEPSLVDYLNKHTHMSEKKRLARVAGILKVSL